MPDDANKPDPPKPDKNNIEQAAQQSPNPSSSTPTVGGEMPTADHQRAAIKASQTSASKGDGQGINHPPITPVFNHAANTPPPTPPPSDPPEQLTPVFNAAANNTDAPSTAKAQHNYNPPTPGPLGPGGVGQAAQAPTNRSDELKAKMKANLQKQKRDQSKGRGR